MFTLIAMGTGVAYLYSLVVTVAPRLLPAALENHDEHSGVYFETAAAIVVLVLFGLAPAIVCYQWGVARISEYGAAWGRFGWIAAFFYVAAAAMRLARFNARAAVQDKRYFEGLPSPSAAAVVAAFIGTAHKYEPSGLLGFDVTGLPGLIIAFAVTALAAILMVSRFPYRSFKDRAAGERVRYSKFLMVPLAIALIAVDPPVVLFIMFGGFALSGPIGWAWLKMRKKPRGGASAGEGS